MPRHIDMIVCPHGETGPKNTRNSEGAIVELRDGCFLMAYTHFYEGGSDFGAGDIRGKRSEDGGATWSEPFLVEPNTAVCNVGRLAMFRLRPVARTAPHVTDLEEWRTDILGHVYVEVNNFYHHRMLFKRSGDEGENWSMPVQINDTGTLGWICQLGDTVVVLSTGRILVPSYAVFGGMNCSFMYYSDDGGDTWRRSMDEISVAFKGPTGRPYAWCGFEEPAVVELRDGRLLCFGRTNTGRLYQSFSGDGGITWSEAEPTMLASSYSPANLKIVPSAGDIVCVWNQVSGQEIADGLARSRLSVAISRDDAKTWTNFKNLESLDDAAYIEPEGGIKDSTTEYEAIRNRLSLLHPGPRREFPEEVRNRYPHWGGYRHIDYPSTTFTSDGHVMFMYGVYATSGDELPMGNKLVVRPVEWLYE